MSPQICWACCFTSSLNFLPPCPYSSVSSFCYFSLSVLFCTAHSQHTWGHTKTRNLFVRMVYLLLHVQIPATFSVLSVWRSILIEMFVRLLKRVFELDFVLLVLRDFSDSAVFCFTSSISTKCFPFRAFLHLGKQTKKKSCLQQERVGHEGHAILGQKLLNT